MNFTIKKYNDDETYFIDFDISLFGVYDRNMAKFLGLTKKKYINILKKHNAYIGNENEYCFDKKIDIKKAIEELEPYLIMKKLVGGNLD